MGGFKTSSSPCCVRELRLPRKKCSLFLIKKCCVIAHNSFINNELSTLVCKHDIFGLGQESFGKQVWAT